MPETPFSRLMVKLAALPDPRIARTRVHRLIDILAIALCATLCGAEGWDDFARFGRAKHSWLQTQLGLELLYGIPCADTFRRVFARLDPRALETLLREWTDTLRQSTQGEIIALDGKTLRHSFDTASGQSSLHMVSAWASNARLVLGQIKVADKSNEITAVPALLRLLDVSGCLVTADAMSCQTALATQIVEQKADYLLSVKDNQPTLAEDIALCFDHAEAKRWENVTHQTHAYSQKGHGRLETRHCDVILLAMDDPFWSDLQARWTGLRSLVRVQRRVREPGKTLAEATVTTRYFISSATSGARALVRGVRLHWGIENRLHHVLDVSLREDACRIRKDHGPENMAVLRHLTLNLLRQEKTSSAGIKARQKLAGWDSQYLSRILIS